MRVHKNHAQKERILLHSKFRKFGMGEGNARDVDEKITSTGDDVVFCIGTDWREEEGK